MAQTGRYDGAERPSTCASSWGNENLLTGVTVLSGLGHARNLVNDISRRSALAVGALLHEAELDEGDYGLLQLGSIGQMQPLCPARKTHAVLSGSAVLVRGTLEADYSAQNNLLMSCDWQEECPERDVGERCVARRKDKLRVLSLVDGLGNPLGRSGELGALRLLNELGGNPLDGALHVVHGVYFSS